MMLTPQEVQEKRFEKAVFGGYDMSGVDDFLETLSGDYTNLYKENAILKSKMKVLIDKLEEYRSVDDEMRKTLRAAQQSATDIKQMAARQADEMVKNAEQTLRGRSQELSQEVERERARLASAKEETLKFVNQLRELYRKEMALLSAIPEMPVRENPKAVRDGNVTSAVKDIGDSMAARLASEGEQDVVEAASKAIETQIAEEAKAAPAIPAEPVTPVIPAAPTAPAAPAEPPKDARVFEVNFGDGSETDFSDIWEPEEDTVVPRPRTDFDDMDLEFGPNYNPMNKGRKGG